MRRSLRLAILVAVCPLLLSCSEDGSTDPSPIVYTPPIVPPALSRLVVEGNVNLTAVGETSQLRAMAQYVDGSSSDVSSQARWFSQNPVALPVSAQGLVSVAALGNSSVSAQFGGRFAQARVVATPPGTLTVSGQVREPGQGGGAGNRPTGVRVFEPRSGQAVMTDSEGLFTMGGLSSVRVRFERADLEPVDVDLHGNVFDDVPMQRIVRLTAGDTVTPVALAPNDLTYTMNGGETCFPCRMIRVDLPAAGTLQLRLKWTAAASLGLWTNGTLYRPNGAVAAVNVDVPTTSGQRVVFVQNLSAQTGHVTFTLETAHTP